MEHTRTLNTALGQIHFFVRSETISGQEADIEFRVIDLEPNLPSGMAVQRVRAVLLLAHSRTGFAQLEYGYRLQADIEGGPESGERLDAMSWEGKHDIVVVGTESGEAISDRMPWLKFKGDPLAFVQYRKDGLNVPLKRVPPGVRVGLHYVVAENSYPEPLKCSAWYAVDIPHDKLLKVES